MRYVIRGLEIRSENAAKPAGSASRWVLRWIRCLPHDLSGLDIGCGKLRYTIPLSKRIAKVTAVDSSVQLDRLQIVSGRLRSVRLYASESLRNVKIHSLEDSTWRRRRYQVVLCTNVLSAIPCTKTRQRLVRDAFSCLAPDGKLLITTQYRNSHFSGWKTDPKAIPYLDGFLVTGKRGTSFYGLLDAAALTSLCLRCGFRVAQSGHVKELAYVVACRPRLKAR